LNIIILFADITIDVFRQKLLFFIKTDVLMLPNPRFLLWGKWIYLCLLLSWTCLSVNGYTLDVVN